jgi:cysteine desulfurase
MRQVYLDNTAAMPLLPEVRDAMMPYFTDTYGNPQSLHNWGDPAREAIEEAREKVASLIGANSEEIIFTSTGTEANNMAIKGLALACADKGKHILISAIEHFSVLNSARSLQKLGFEVTTIPVDKFGRIDPEEVTKNIRPDTILISIQHANSEVGTIQALNKIVKNVNKGSIIFHTDAIASTGTVPINVQELGIDALSLAGNQFYGPKGSAALWIRKGTRIIPLMDGGIQEGGRRPGTENVPAIVGLGKAAELAARDMSIRLSRLTVLRDKLIQVAISKVDHMILTGHPAERLPHYASFGIEFIEGEAILMLLNSMGIAAASGSACTSRALKASHVLIAMGIPHEIAQGSTLFSLGLETTEEDINYVLESLPPIVDRLRQMSPLYAKFIKEKRG